MKGIITFVEYVSEKDESGQLIIAEKLTKEKDVGMHSIIYYAQDENNVQTQVHSISIEIISTAEEEKEDAIVQTYTIRAPKIGVIDEETKVVKESSFLDNAMSVPTAKIKSVSSSGEVEISFSKKMRVLDLEIYAKKVDKNLRFLNEKPLEEEPAVQSLWKLV